MKKWLCLLISILTFIIGCASGYENRPFREGDNDYWNSILHNRTLEQSRDEEWAPKARLSIKSFKNLATARVSAMRNEYIG